MAELQLGSESRVLDDGTDIVLAAGQLGVRFGCLSGHCGVCTIEIEEGENLLSEKNELEKLFSLGEKQRLACQCSIESGVVRIKQN